MYYMFSSISYLFRKYIMGRKKKLIERDATFNLVGIHGIKPCINDIICGIASRMDAEESSKRSYYKTSAFWDDFSIFGRKKKKGNKKKYRSLELFPMEEDDYLTNGYNDDLPFGGAEVSDSIEDSVINGYKSIIFYKDITNELDYREFHSLKAFNDYCDKENIYIPRFDASNLEYWSEVHCCLDPGDLVYGEKTLVTDRNYDVLYWSVMSTAPDEAYSKAVSKSGKGGVDGSN